MPLPFQITESQLERIKPYFPLSHAIARVDDLRIISGIIYVIRNGLQWKDARQCDHRQRVQCVESYVPKSQRNLPNEERHLFG